MLLSVSYGNEKEQNWNIPLALVVFCIPTFLFLVICFMFRFARRLAEYFTIAVLNRIERNEMDHLKAIQEERNYRSILAREYVAAIESGLLKKGRKLGRIFLMPQTFAGSRQYYQKKYADLMTIVRHVGNPTWFIYHDAICFAKAFLGL